jgi:hypothetical protein
VSKWCFRYCTYVLRRGIASGGIDNAIISGLDADATLGLLHDDSDYESVVGLGLLADVLDGVVDLGDLIGTVVGVSRIVNTSLTM